MEHKDWTVEQWKKKVLWSDESRFTLFQTDESIGVRRVADLSGAPIALNAHCTSPCSQCYDVELLQLIRSKFSDGMGPKKMHRLTN